MYLLDTNWDVLMLKNSKKKITKCTRMLFSRLEKQQPRRASILNLSELFFLLSLDNPTSYIQSYIVHFPHLASVFFPWLCSLLWSLSAPCLWGLITHDTGTCCWCQISRRLQKRLPFCRFCPTCVFCLFWKWCSDHVSGGWCHSPPFLCQPKASEPFWSPKIRSLVTT